MAAGAQKRAKHSARAQIDSYVSVHDANQQGDGDNEAPDDRNLPSC